MVTAVCPRASAWHPGSASWGCRHCRWLSALAAAHALRVASPPVHICMRRVPASSPRCSASSGSEGAGEPGVAPRLSRSQEPVVWGTARVPQVATRWRAASGPGSCRPAHPRPGPLLGAPSRRVSVACPALHSVRPLPNPGSLPGPSPLPGSCFPHPLLPPSPQGQESALLTSCLPGTGAPWGPELSAGPAVSLAPARVPGADARPVFAEWRVRSRVFPGRGALGASAGLSLCTWRAGQPGLTPSGSSRIPS